MHRTRFLMGFAPLLLASGLAWAAGPGEPPGPGEYRCQTGAKIAGLRTNACEYRPRTADPDRLNELIQFAKQKIEIIVYPNTPNIEPHPGVGGKTIEWWIESLEASQALGNLIQFHDYEDQDDPKIQVAVNIYSFESGFERDLGYELGAFYGNRDYPDKDKNLTGSVIKGAIDTLLHIGNPLTSFLSLGIKAYSQKTEKFFVREDVFECPQNKWCDVSRTRTFYIQTGVSAPEKEHLGLEFRTFAAPTRDGGVELSNTNITYSEPTGDKDAPVDTFNPVQSQDLVLGKEEIQVLAREALRVDSRTGRILGYSKARNNSQFLVTIRAEVGRPIGFFGRDDRSYSKEELAAMPDGKASLQDLLSSMRLVCFENKVNPFNPDPICGFRLSRMDRKYLDAVLKVRVDGKLRYGQDRVKQVMLGDILEGKGYFQIPALKGDKEYTVTMELDDSNSAARSRREAEPVKGLRFRFGYYPGLSKPVTMGSDEVARSVGFEWLH